MGWNFEAILPLECAKRTPFEKLGLVVYIVNSELAIATLPGPQLIHTSVSLVMIGIRFVTRCWSRCTGVPDEELNCSLITRPNRILQKES